MMATPLQLPRITPTQAYLGTLLASRQTYYAFTLSEQPCTVTLSPTTSVAKTGLQLLLTLNGQSLSINIDQPALTWLVPGNLATQAILQLPESLMMAALHATLDAPLHTLSQSLGVSVSLVGLQADNTNDVAANLTLRFDSNGAMYHGHLLANEAIIDLCKKLPAHLHTQLPDIPVWVSLAAGRTRMPTVAIKHIAIGDILFLQHYVAAPQYIIWLNAQTAFLGEAQDNTMTLQQRIEPMAENQDVADFDDTHDALDDTEQTTEEPSGQDQDSGINLADVSVELLFEVGRQQLTMHELAAIQPGYVFTLDRSIEQPVRLRANGKVIAECQLVEIDNRLGARITTLKPS